MRLSAVAKFHQILLVVVSSGGGGGGGETGGKMDVGAQIHLKLSTYVVLKIIR